MQGERERKKSKVHRADSVKRVMAENLKFDAIAFRSICFDSHEMVAGALYSRNAGEVEIRAALEFRYRLIHNYCEKRFRIHTKRYSRWRSLLVALAARARETTEGITSPS